MLLSRVATDLRLAATPLISVPSPVSAVIVGVIVIAAMSMVAFSIRRTWARRHHPKEPRPKKHPFYDVMEPYAEGAKVVLQMFIGAGLALLVSLKLLNHLGLGFSIPFLTEQVYSRPTLDIVGLALGYSSALELAYALFTEGPDEAVEPLIMGLAAALLVVVSEIPPLDIVRSVGVALLVAALAGLFLIRRVFIVPPD
jgi:RsiW-degrading membrane proteinase PrsW (M82 family)